MMSSSNLPDIAVVVGASGGVGAALVARLAGDRRFAAVLALSRCSANAPSGPRIVQGAIDITDPASIEAAAEQARRLGSVRLVIVASGVLHADGIAPEKSWSAIDADTMARVFAVNSIGPALVARFFLPLLPRQGRAVFAALSARVGSIDDNRLGGWYSYRASKAALNMLLKTLAIELARRAPEAICIGLHPGTVDTDLSQPFSGKLAPDRLFSPAQSADHMLKVIEGVGADDSGRVLAWDGQVIPA